MLDDYFSSKEFLESQDAAPLLDQSSVFCNHQTTIPSAHQLVTSSPFADSGVSLDMISLNHSSIATEDEDVFMSESIMSEQKMAASVSSTDSSSSTNTAIFNALNGLSRSRRSHFSNAINSSEFKSRSGEFLSNFIIFCFKLKPTIAIKNLYFLNCYFKYLFSPVSVGKWIFKTISILKYIKVLISDFMSLRCFIILLQYCIIRA